MQDDSFEQKRHSMVQEQLEKRGIKSRALLTVMREIPRHLFIPEKFAELAYNDQAISLGDGKSISQPYVVAFMLEKLGLEGNFKVLDVGTGSGYQTAIIAELCEKVYTIEIDNQLHERSKRTLGELGYTNISFKLGDGLLGWKEHAPFDAIILSAAAESVPRELLSQLSKNGRMILPLGTESQSLVLLSKKDGKLSIEELGAVQFVKIQGNPGDLQ